MLDLMFAAALSGMRAAEAVEDSPRERIHFPLATAPYERRPVERDWRKLVQQNFSAEVKGECSVFFQKDLGGFGALKLTSTCREED